MVCCGRGVEMAIEGSVEVLGDSGSTLGPSCSGYSVGWEGSWDPMVQSLEPFCFLDLHLVDHLHRKVILRPIYVIG